ncbi:MAG: sensor histidine kinase [Myxococcales bacterium]|nr:sensor histidine kinase [Myxococcales bacterium]MBL0196572.1 sensor histidine kinase [Myxococcales bacterium]HQY63893.1 ATP-binding protein [Polyangiaceae bacterium]
MSDPPDLGLPSRIVLNDPSPFLSAVTASPWSHANLDELETVDMWALVALCALARHERSEDARCDVYHRSGSAAARFAHAVGFDAARDGREPPRSEVERTVPIQRVTFGQARVAERIARLAVPSDDESESRDALAYVIDELLRNVIQHSGDPLGAVVGAQRMAAGRGDYTRDTVQVIVADTGRGILESLRRFHNVETAQAALEKAIRPHISGTFPEGQTGSLNNAGLGLFFTSEMAKLTAGRFLLATRGASLLLTSDDAAGTHRAQLLSPSGTGFPGTLAVFELPLEVVDRDALLDVIRNRVDERTPGPGTRRWLSYAPPPPDTEHLSVRECLDDPGTAVAFGERVRVLVAAGRPVALDFRDMGIATQSFLHALLFQAVRVGWAMGAPIHVIDASSAVRSGLDYLESYALK